MPTQAGAHLGRERLDVDDDEIDQADPLRLELRELIGDVAPGEDPRVDGRVEGLDLAADERRDLGQVGHAPDRDAFAREVLAGTVGRDDIDLELAQVPRQRSDALAVRD